MPPIAFLLPLGAAWLVFAWPTLAGLVGVYRTDENFSHGFLVPAISLAAAWRLRRELASASLRERLPGAAPLGAGIGLVLFSRWYELALLPRGVIAMFMAGVGMVLVLTGLVWLAFGHRGVWRLHFPLGFLLLGVPVPSFLLHRVTVPLQQVSASISAAALRLIGIAVQRRGSVLSFPAGQLGVDEACSGIRSLAVMVAVALAMAHFSRLRWRGTLALLLAAAPLAVLANALRVFVSGIFFSRGWVQLTRGGPHELLGLLTFAMAIAIFAALSNTFAEAPTGPAPHGAAPGSAPQSPRTAPAAAAPAPQPAGTPAPGAPDLPLSSAGPAGPRSTLCVPLSAPRSLLASFANAAFASAMALACGAAISFLLDAHYDRLYQADAARLAGRRSLDRFPDRVGPYVRTGTQDLSEGEFAMLEPSEKSIGIYLGPDGRSSTVTVLYWDPPQGRPSRRPDLLRRPHSPDWCYPAAGWRRIRRYDDYCPPDVIPGEQGRIRVFERDGESVVVLYWTGVTAARTDALDQVWQRLLDMAHSWTHPPLANLHTVCISTPAGADPAAAREAALALARELGRVLPEYGIGRPP